MIWWRSNSPSKTIMISVWELLSLSLMPQEESREMVEILMRSQSSSRPSETWTCQSSLLTMLSFSITYSWTCSQTVKSQRTIMMTYRLPLKSRCWGRICNWMRILLWKSCNCTNQRSLDMVTCLSVWLCQVKQDAGRFFRMHSINLMKKKRKGKAQMLKSISTKQ